MRFGFLCAAIALAGAASSSLAQVQLPIPAFNRTFTGALTRGFWFQAPTTFVVTGLRVPDEAARGLQVVEFIDFGTTPPPAFSATVVGTQMFYSNGQPSSQILSTNITCVQGNFYGVLGACGDTTSVSNSYGPTGAFNTTLFGQPITLTRLGTQFNIANGGNNPCWSEAAFEPSRVEVYCAPPTGFATSRKFGDGCIRNAGTVHEFFPTAAANDLNGASVSMIFNGSNGYLALPGLNPYIAPSPAATQLVLGDDAETTVTLGSALPYPGGSTTSLTVCSNGFISTGSGNGTAFTPAEAAFLGFPQTAWCNWHDYNPAAGGAVRFEEVGNLSIVTWDGVVDFSFTTPNTFQFQFDRATGNVDIVFQSISGLGNVGYLVGFKCGGPVLPVTSVDLSALLPSTFQAGCDTLPLDFDSSARPVLGTSINLVTTRIPATASVTIHRLTFGSQVPPIDLTPLGAPGCFAHVNPVGPSNIFLVGSPSTTSALALPNNPALAGTTLFGQAASLVPGINALSIITSNGLELKADIN